MGIKLKFVRRVNIYNKAEGLTEPSGLALSPDGRSLWTVSDDTKRLFKLDLDGTPTDGESFPAVKKEFEGITMSKSGKSPLCSARDRQCNSKVQREKEEQGFKRASLEIEGIQENQGAFLGTRYQ